MPTTTSVRIRPSMVWNELSNSSEYERMLSMIETTPSPFGEPVLREQMRIPNMNQETKENIQCILLTGYPEYKMNNYGMKFNGNTAYFQRWLTDRIVVEFVLDFETMTATVYKPTTSHMRSLTNALLAAQGFEVVVTRDLLTVPKGAKDIMALPLDPLIKIDDTELFSRASVILPRAERQETSISGLSPAEMLERIRGLGTVEYRI